MMVVMEFNVAEIQQKLQPIFSAHPEVGFVYLFGSRAAKTAGPLSDYDLAVYVNDEDAARRGALRLRLIADAMKALHTDNIDLHILNDIHLPELKYHIIAEGKLLFEREPFRIIVEPRILNEYFDFRRLLQKYHLTKS